MSIQPTFESIADVEAQAQRMRAYFQTGATLPVEHRRQALRQLKAYLKANEERVLEALAEDLGKAPFEGYATELGIVYDEINLCLKHLGRWAKPRRVRTPIVHFHSTSKVYASPLGVALVLSPWNYPVQLALVPLVDAIAAGNCVALKPSRTSIATSKLLMEMTASLFPPEFVCGFPGSAEMNDWLLDVRWDKLFFTGSPSVGHRVMGLVENRNPDATVAFGGRGDAETLRIEPTCLVGVTLDDPVMGEEIFGPVLPVITYRTLDEAFAVVRTFETPLATYVFSDDKDVQQRVIRELPFGGATINDVVIHLANNHMGFGGLGNSGMGSFHGKAGFDCFTHYKSTLKKGTWLEMPIRNPPFDDAKMRLLKMLMK